VDAHSTRRVVDVIGATAALIFAAPLLLALTLLAGVRRERRAVDGRELRVFRFSVDRSTATGRFVRRHPELQLVPGLLDVIRGHRTLGRPHLKTGSVAVQNQTPASELAALEGRGQRRVAARARGAGRPRGRRVVRASSRGGDSGDPDLGEPPGHRPPVGRSA
jgi:hypothetical protein